MESGEVPGPGLLFVSLAFVVLLPKRSGGARVPALLWPVVLKAPYIPGACAWLSLSFVAPHLWIALLQSHLRQMVVLKMTENGILGDSWRTVVYLITFPSALALLTS